jgi:signal transduction histidine kinase
VQQNFNATLQQAIVQGTSAHLMERYTIEANLLDLAANNTTVTNDQLRRTAESMGAYLGAENQSFALIEENILLYTCLPQNIANSDLQAALNAGSEHCIVRQIGNDYYLLMASKVQTSLRQLTLLSAFNITFIFTARQNGLRYLWQIEAVLLAAAITVVVPLSRYLTKPIRQLQTTAGQIAGGDYHKRTQVTTTDEISSLARSFDQMAEAVQQNVEELNQSIQQRDDFVTAFSHEVKTPITTLVSYADILRRTEESPEMRHMAATYIYKEAKRLEELGRKLMELMGLASGEIETEAFAAKDLAGEVQRSLSPQFPKMQLVCHGNTEAIVLADRVLAADLLRNLVSNAMHAQDGTGSVIVHFRKAKTACRVLVCDAGRGMAHEELSRITEPFYMVDKSRSRGQNGSGMGLALAQKIAVLHGGQLRYRSIPGKGTAVRFTLPIQAKEELQ